MHSTQVCMFCRYRRTVFEDGVRMPCRHAARPAEDDREAGAPAQPRPELALRKPGIKMETQRHFR